jgi:hypothetical protein
MGNYNKRYLLIYLVSNQNSCRSEEKKNNKVKNESFTKTVICGIAAGGCACLLTNSEFQQTISSSAKAAKMTTRLQR